MTAHEDGRFYVYQYHAYTKEWRLMDWSEDEQTARTLFATRIAQRPGPPVRLFDGDKLIAERGVVNS